MPQSEDKHKRKKAKPRTEDKPSASKRDNGWRYKWNDEKKLMEFSNE